MLRSFSRSFAELFKEMFFATVKKEKVLVSTFKYSELVKFCVSDLEIVHGCINGLVELLGVRDTVCCQNALTVSLSALPEFSKLNQAWMLLGETMLRTAIKVINDGYQKSNHYSAALFIAEIYVGLRPLTTIPFNTLSGLQGMTDVALQVSMFLIRNLKTTYQRQGPKNSKPRLCLNFSRGSQGYLWLTSLRLQTGVNSQMHLKSIEMRQSCSNANPKTLDDLTC